MVASAPSTSTSSAGSIAHTDWDHRGHGRHFGQCRCQCTVPVRRRVLIAKRRDIRLVPTSVHEFGGRRARRCRPRQSAVAEAMQPKVWIDDPPHRLLAINTREWAVATRSSARNMHCPTVRGAHQGASDAHEDRCPSRLDTCYPHWSALASGGGQVGFGAAIGVRPTIGWARGLPPIDPK